MGCSLAIVFQFEAKINKNNTRCKLGGRFRGTELMVEDATAAHSFLYISTKSATHSFCFLCNSASIWCEKYSSKIFDANDVSDLNSDDKQETRYIGDGGGAKEVSWWNLRKDDIYRAWVRVRSADFKQLQPDPRQGNIRICLV